MKNPKLALLGEQIRRLREDKNLSQEQFAGLAGIDRAYYGGVERGERNVAALNLIKVADALNAEVGKLFPPLSALRRSAKGERHATFYEQISGPDSWNTEWLGPLGVSGFAAAVELRLPGPGFAVPGGAGDGTIPLAEPYPVQGLLGPREARQPEGEAGQRPTV